MTQTEPSVSFEVLGRNPIWVRSHIDGEVRVFRRSEKGELAAGDWLCVSGKRPIWFKVRNVGVEEEDKRVLESESELAEGLLNGSELEGVDVSGIDPVKVGNLKMVRAQRMRLNSCNVAKLMLLDLPLHILIEILSRLPSESVCCIRCVSKALLKTVDDPSFVALHTRLLTATTNEVAQAPQLMSFAAPFPSRKPPLPFHQISEVIADLQPVTFDGSALTTRGNYAINVVASGYDDPTYMIDFVFCNLFCFRDEIDRKRGVCFLVDPLRGEILRLPMTKDANYPPYCDWYGMGFDDITNTLKILHVIQGTPGGRMLTQVLVLGTSSWREIPSTPPCPLSNFRNLFSRKNVCAYGDMHWLLAGETTCRIISFDFKNEEFCSTPHPNLHENSLLWMHLHLLTLRGSLALVDTSLSEGMTTKIEIWVMKDYDKKEWRRAYNLNIEMFDLRKEFDMKWHHWYVSCGEWEHGIFFKNFEKIPTFFLDLRCGSMNPVTCGSGYRTKILSYTGSLICLRDYDSLVEAILSNRSMKSYGNLLKEEAQGGFRLCEVHKLRVVSVIREGSSDIAHKALV